MLPFWITEWNKFACMNAFVQCSRPSAQRAVCSRLPNREPEIQVASLTVPKGQYAMEPGGWHLLSTWEYPHFTLALTLTLKCRCFHSVRYHQCDIVLKWKMLEFPLSLPQILIIYWCWRFSINGGVYINIQLANLLSACHVIFHYDLLTTTVSSCLLYVGFISVSFFNFNDKVFRKLF